MEIPTFWAVIVGVLAFASCLTIGHPASGGLTVEFGISATTVGVVALFWLPPLLRVWSLTGGKLEAAGVAASSKGLLGSPEELIERLTTIRTASEEAKRQAPEAEEVLRSVDKEVAEIATEYLVGSGAVNDAAITALARHYEQLREDMPPGNPRTVEMTRIVNEARVRGEADPEAASSWGVKLIRSNSEGERIVGLAFLQVAPSVTALSDVLDLIRHSTTAFEMFHALMTLEAMITVLTRTERDRARQVLVDELEDPRGVGIAADPNLPGLIGEVSARLGAGPPA